MRPIWQGCAVPAKSRDRARNDRTPCATWGHDDDLDRICHDYIVNELQCIPHH
ncbi:MAG: hypothetical protein CM15mP120_22210 [Pseudomonadota bacterium]|nr:MAG: hypothetical protein CM15mP120_22210 [Pseudomonadota bacterium]